MIHVSKNITIRQEPDTVYGFWRQLENLPRFMEHLEAVRMSTDGRSHWVAKGPAGRTYEWDAEITEDIPNERLAWHSLPGSDVENRGIVRFRPAPTDRGTEVQVDVYYDAPGGRAGSIVATLFGEEPQQQIRDDLRRFKQVMETGEVVRSDGSLEGLGQGSFKQRPAQPSNDDTGRAAKTRKGAR